MTQSTEKVLAERPLRVGIFSAVEMADEAVNKLLAVGFTKSEINVLCSDATIEAHFREFEHQDPAGTHSPKAALTGGAIGAVLGGLTVVTGAILSGGLALLATAPIAAWGGGAAGGLIGAMMARGIERELADFYDQAVTKGKILVAIDLHNSDEPDRLARAAEILSTSGAEPLPLPEG